MPMYRKKPVVIEAMQWDGTPAGATPIIEWALRYDSCIRWHEERTHDSATHVDTGVTHSYPRVTPVPTHLAIDTLEGTMRASAGDFIIKGVSGEFYPCKPDIFESPYEAA